MLFVFIAIVLTFWIGVMGYGLGMRVTLPQKKKNKPLIKVTVPDDITTPVQYALIYSPIDFTDRIFKALEDEWAKEHPDTEEGLRKQITELGNLIRDKSAVISDKNKTIRGLTTSNMELSRNQRDIQVTQVQELNGVAYDIIHYKGYTMKVPKQLGTSKHSWNYVNAFDDPYTLSPDYSIMDKP